MKKVLNLFGFVFMVAIITLSITACSGDKTYDCTHCNDARCDVCDPQPCEGCEDHDCTDCFDKVPLNITFANLTKGQGITLVFPADYSNKVAIIAKFETAMSGMDANAEAMSITGKTNAILARGLKIIIEETQNASYGVKATTDKKNLIAETSALEMNEFTGSEIAGLIMGLINGDGLVA